MAKVYKFKPGDVVQIRDDLEVERYYRMQNSPHEKNCVNDVMMRYLGQKTKIIHISHEQYKLKADGATYYWTDEMLIGYYG